VGGRTVRLQLRVEDDRGDPVAGETAVRRLAERGIPAIIGGLQASVAFAAARAAETTGTLLLVPSATDPEVTKATTRVFRVCFDDGRAGAAMARYAFRTLGGRRAAVIYDEGEPYNMTLASAFMETFRVLGGTVVSEQPFRDERATADFRPLLAEASRARPDVLFSPNYYRATVAIAVQARALGMRAVVLSGEGANSPDLPLLGGDAVEGTAFPAHFAPDDRARAVRLFRERYRRAHGQDPDMMAALGYDALRLVLEALRRAGSADPRLLRDAIAGVRRFDGATGRITFEGSPDPRKDVVIVRIRDGRAVFHARVNP
jgi:branched-chain amino acid transport system substrate-binding protein